MGVFSKSIEHRRPKDLPENLAVFRATAIYPWEQLVLNTISPKLDHGEKNDGLKIFLPHPTETDPTLSPATVYIRNPRCAS